MDKNKEGFVQGVAYAAAQVMRLHDDPTCARNVIEESGIPMDDFKCAAEYDLRVLRKEIPKIPVGIE